MELAAGGETLGEMKIQIFLGDSLLPLLLQIAMMPLNYIVKKCTGGYKFIKLRKINHHMGMDFISISAENKKELETFIQTVRIYC